MLFLLVFVLALQARVLAQNEGSCMCRYEGSCSTDSDCCAGQICIYSNPFYSQCNVDPQQEEGPPGCKSTGQGWGCTADSDCCNEAAVCSTSRICLLQCQVTDGYRPSSAPIAPPEPTYLPSRRPTVFPTTSTPTDTSSPTASTAPTQTLAPTVSAAPTFTSTNPWTSDCMCQYSPGCESDSDCCSGQVCQDYGTWSQCIESPTLRNKPELPNPICKATITTLPLVADDFGCVVDADCCNPSAKCASGVCRFPDTCSETSNYPVFNPVTSPVLSPVTIPTVVPPTMPTVGLGYLSTSGNQIISSTGESFRMTGINWFGFETSMYVPHGLWIRGYKSVLDQVVDLGFNTLRIPFCNEALRAGNTIGGGINYNVNPELLGMREPIQVLDEIIRYAGSLGLRVFLDRHSSKADGLLAEDIWYIPGDDYYTEDRWIRDWVMLARRYANNPVIVGADLFNEPKRSAIWSEWARASERCANAIHTVNPNWLIIVEGVETFEGEKTWWGGNLRGVRTDPVVLVSSNKLVYSAHDYPSTVFEQPWFSDPDYPNNLKDIWNENWGYIYKEGIAPLIIGEFGTKLQIDSDKLWIDKLTDYMDGDFDLNGGNGLVGSDKGISWTFWCVNPNSGDTGGILKNDWNTVETEKMTYLFDSLEPPSPVEEPIQSPVSTPVVSPVSVPVSVPVPTPVAAPVSVPVPGPVSVPFTAPTSPTIPTVPTVSVNPYIRTTDWYVNPSYQSSLASSIATADGRAKVVMEAMTDISSAYWIDVKAKLYGSGTGTLEGILDDAAQRENKKLVTLIIYDLPNRDCHARASNGEICCTYNSDGTCDYSAGGDCSAGLNEYRTQYIDPFYEIVSRYHEQVEIVLIIEPDSLPNLATNLANPHCGNTATQASYKEGISYTINKFKDLSVTMYLDAAHGGWLGWVDNMRLFTDLVVSMEFELSSLRGFATNVANYQPVGLMCPFQSNDGLRNDYCLNGQHQMDPCCADPCGLSLEWNPGHNEMNYAALLRNAFSQATNGLYTGYILIDTGRNGVSDMRSDCANWCNARGAGIGLLPTTDTSESHLIDALFWLKTPGESDGCTEELPNGAMCPRFDDFCGSVDSIGSRPGEPRAPEAGHWFDYQIKMLAENALFARDDLITNYPSEAPVLPEFDCSGNTYWNKKKGFKRDKKVAFKGLLYQAKRFNRDRNPEQWSTHESSGKNVWNIVGTCKESTERKLEVVTMEEWNLSNAYIADNGIFFYTFLLLSGVLLIGIYGIMMHKGYCFGHHEEHLLPITGKCDDTDSEML